MRWSVAVVAMVLVVGLSGCLGGGFFEPQSSLRYNPWFGTYEFSTSQEQSLTASGVEAWKDDPTRGAGMKIDELSFGNESAALLGAMVATMEGYRAQMEEYQGIQQKVNEGIFGTLEGLTGAIGGLQQF